MANKSGWWDLEITDEDVELSDNDRQHIAQLIIEGYTSGEVVQDDDNSDE